ncbi:MAG TPA: DUF2188 domain-containing protein [Chitinophagaceae bacterium]|jgi:hypothetical protein|nr:DUF2188 domain-containing protein [Chitinophagaceae bacterium]
MRKFLYVSPLGTQWKVHWQHDEYGKVFVTKEEAIRHAKKIVSQLAEGQISSIRVQKADGTFQDEWTYGNDPYPPAE